MLCKFGGGWIIKNLHLIGLASYVHVSVHLRVHVSKKVYVRAYATFLSLWN